MVKDVSKDLLWAKIQLLISKLLVQVDMEVNLKKQSKVLGLQLNSTKEL
jgi:hypothetical protein